MKSRNNNFSSEYLSIMNTYLDKYGIEITPDFNFYIADDCLSLVGTCFGLVDPSSILVSTCSSLVGTSFSLVGTCSSLIVNSFVFNGNPNIPTYKIFRFKDSLCHGIHYFENKSTLLFNHYNWEFIGRVDSHVNSFPLLYNSYFHFFIIVFVMAFFSQKVGSVASYVVSLLVPRSLTQDYDLYLGNLSLDHFYRVVASILSLVYLFFGIVFEWLQYKFYVRKTIKLNLYWYIFCGVMYCLNIIIGIFFTNALWYLIHPQFTNHHALLLASPGSVIMSGIWYSFRVAPRIPEYDIINCIFRSLLETLTFICMCVSTYGSWNLFTSNVPANMVHPISIILGFVIHFVIGYYIVGLEIHQRSPVIYGLLYFFWWSTAIFNTNSLVAIFIENLPYNLYARYWVITIVLTSISVIVNYPCYYLNSAINTPSDISPDIDLGITDHSPANRNLGVIQRTIEFINRNRLAIALRLYICIVSYCFCGGLLWSLLILHFT